MKLMIVMGIMVSLNIQAAVNDCEILSKKQAQTALSHIEANDIYSYTVVDLFCEACLDDYPKPIVVNDYRIKKNPKGFSLYLDGVAFNLAYLYSGGTNLAQVVGCNTFAVSKYLF